MRSSRPFAKVAICHPSCNPPSLRKGKRKCALPMKPANRWNRLLAAVSFAGLLFGLVSMAAASDVGDRLEKGFLAAGLGSAAYLVALDERQRDEGGDHRRSGIDAARRHRRLSGVQPVGRHSRRAGALHEPAVARHDAISPPPRPIGSGWKCVSTTAPAGRAAAGRGSSPPRRCRRSSSSETQAKGPAKFDAVLPQPQTNHGYYRDIAVLAFPTPTAKATIDRLAAEDAFAAGI